MKVKDITGQTFGRLKVLNFAGPDRRGHALFRCQCSCKDGTIITVLGEHLRYGHTQSCGCIQRERARQAKTKWQTTEERQAADLFRDMKKRCTNPNYNEYDRYGGRGITICDEWMQDRSKFVKWAIENGYQKGLEIDRINNDAGYSPDNCRFVGRITQANNKSSNRRIEIDGITHTLAEWVDIAEVDYDRLQFLLNYSFQKFMDEITSSPRLQAYLKEHSICT